MTLHPNFDDAEVRSLTLGDPSGAMRPPSTALVWFAGALILVLAGVGLYRGVSMSSPHHDVEARAAADAAGAAPAAAATPAVVLPHDDQWSALSGPKINDPTPKAQAVSSAQPDAGDDDADSSTSSAQATVADDSGPKDALQAIGDAQTAPPVGAAQAPAAPAVAPHRSPDPGKGVSSAEPTP